MRREATTTLTTVIDIRKVNITRGACRYHPGRRTPPLFIPTVLPFINGTALIIFAVYAHIIAEQAIHPDISKPQLILRHAKLPLQIHPQTFVCPPRSNTLVKIAV